MALNPKSYEPLGKIFPLIFFGDYPSKFLIKYLIKIDLVLFPINS